MPEQYDPLAIEPEILKFWEKNKVYDKARKAGKGKEKFYFLQGPPYTSGRLHIGHAWNNTMKDMVLRYKRMRGFDVWDRAGYDMHGLPTENKVQQKFNLKTKEDILSFGMEKFIRECREFSETNAKLMDKDLWRLGVWMDYKNAYWPITNSFIEGEWWLIKRAHEEKRLYKGKKVMTWCASCETALAKHELEYETVTDKSIFLKFKIKGKTNEHLIVWTTTPWTIPYNMAVMVNPELDYLRCEVQDADGAGTQEVWVLAEALAGPVITAVAGKKFKVLEKVKGESLDGTKYAHPLEKDIPLFAELRKTSPRLHTVILSSEYVDASAGSGLVHCAPGCGPEDQEAGAKYGLLPFNQLDERGRFVDMGAFTRWVAKEDDAKFIQALDDAGALLETAPVDHEYAHCWRCRKPVVFRTTEQWFLRVTDLCDAMREHNKDVRWVPARCGAQYDQWLANLHDNAITRQRFWGAPVPIWECKECNHITVVGTSEELKKLGAKKIPKDLHRPWIDEVEFPCPSCKKPVRRIPDVLDVWIDAGTLSWNCLDYPVDKKLLPSLYPADFVLEATEQVRLWFPMLNICSHIALGKQAYKSVYTTGMILDYQGMKMSKSLGNIISPYEVVDKHGADLLRYYMGAINAGENINFSWPDIEARHRNLGVLWNTHNYLMELAGQAGQNPLKLDPAKLDFGMEEKFIISRLHSTVFRCTALMDAYRLDEVIGEIESLYLDLSRTYIQMVREKASGGTPAQRGAVLYSVYSTLMGVTRMMAVVTPFLAEKLYQAERKAFKLKDASVHLCEWPKASRQFVDEKLEARMRIAQEAMTAMAYAREKANLSLRWPVRQITVTSTDPAVLEAVESMRDLIEGQLNVKELHTHKSLPGLKETVRANAGALGKEFKALAPKVLAKLAMENAKTLLGHLAKDGVIKLKVDKESVELKAEHLIIEREVPAGLIEAEFRGGRVYLDMSRTPELDAEGYAREVMRRVQQLRKDSGLAKQDRVALYLQVSPGMEKTLAPWLQRMADRCGADAISVGLKEPPSKFAHTAEQEIRNEVVRIFLLPKLTGK